MTVKVTQDSGEAEVKQEKSQRQQEIERLRKNRVPPGVRTMNLDYPSKEGYVRRVVVDRPGRVDQFLRGGWAFVQQDDLPESPSAGLKVTTRESVDSRVSQVVGSHKDGSPQHGYLMELPTELYDEDQAAKMEQVDALEGTLRAGMDSDGGNPAGPGPNQPGADGRYVGRQGIKIQQKGGRR